MKTLNSFLRTLLLTLILVSTATAALAYDMKVNGVCYNINGDEAYVTYNDYYGYGSYSTNERYNRTTKYSGHITIPETVTYNGLTYSVTGIGSYAFNNCTPLTSVSIPESVTYIANDAFYNCSSLLCIAIPLSVTSIGNSAFQYCYGLTSITIPDSVTSIGSYAFEGCI